MGNPSSRSALPSALLTLPLTAGFAAHLINAAVCEGCGDCGATSNCMSIEPLETDLGRKPKINQSSCNKDYSCVEGFCPSFVTVHGGKLRKPGASRATQTTPAWTDPLPHPDIAEPTRAFSVLIGGIGGTGVVTIGQTLAMAAHVQGLFSSNLDVTGLAQKYGAVGSHVRIAPQPELLHATRIATGEADTMIGCDLIVAATDESLSRLALGKSQAVVCTDLVPTAEFARNPDWHVDSAALIARLRDAVGGQAFLLEGQRLALPQSIRGYGHVKEAQAATANASRAELLAEPRAVDGPQALAA